MRKTVMAGVLILSLFLFTISASAQGVKAVFTVDQSDYTMDNQTFQMDAKTFIKNERTYVPIRYLALALGVAEKDIGWQSPNVTLKLADTELKLTESSKTLYKNNQAVQMDVAVINQNGRTYLPARWVAEAFGYEVKWQPPKVLIGHDIPEEKIQNAPFPAQLFELEMQVGSRNATGIKLDGSEVKITLDEAPFLVVQDKVIADRFADKKEGAIYEKYPPEIMPEIKGLGMYLPFASVARAFGVPEGGNIKWDGKKLTVIKKPDWYGTYTLNSKETIWTWPGRKENLKRKMEGPLLVKNNVAMLPCTEAYPLILAHFDSKGEYNFIDALSDYSNSTEGARNGKPSLAILKPKR